MVTEDYEETVFEADAEKVRDVLTQLVSQVCPRPPLGLQCCQTSLRYGAVLRAT